jgi:hypothetical protein
MNVTGGDYGVQSMIAPLRRVLLKHARDAYRDVDAVAAGWRSLGYSGPPDLDQAVKQYDEFVALLRQDVPVIERCMMVAGNPVTRRRLQDAGRPSLNSTEARSL